MDLTDDISKTKKERGKTAPIIIEVERQLKLRLSSRAQQSKVWLWRLGLTWGLSVPHRL